MKWPFQKREEPRPSPVQEAAWRLQQQANDLKTLIRDTARVVPPLDDRKKS